ncbi:MAG: leucine-rich repeat domain-containing protein [Verrucomicrobiales bacterium]|nr:leucine-rich repeat domain-containing protein [Verrucomicrobiales bacterium]
MLQQNITSGRYRVSMRLFCLAWISAGLLTYAAEPAAPAPPSPPIFADKNLESAVRRYVFEKRDTDKPIVEADVVNLSTLEARGLGITNLAGLEKCRSLALIDLSRNRIKDVSALKGLGMLQSLTLSDNALEDIAPLASLPSLQYLELSRNRLKTLEAVRGLTNLNALYASSNRIADLSPVLGLRRLSSLYLDDNKLKSIEGIGTLKALFTLSLNRNSIADLAPLDGVGTLFNLFIEGNRIRNLTPLIEIAKKDTEHRFAPFLTVYLKGNPLSSKARKEQIDELKAIGTKVVQ